MSRTSMHLTERQLKGIDKLGDAMLPGHDDLVGFSTLGCSRHADRILDHMPESDRNDLKMLLTLMSFLPLFLVRGFLNLLELTAELGGPVGSLLRFVRIGVRGLVMTLYYSDPKVTEQIGYKVDVYTADMRAPAPADIHRSPEA